MTSVKVLGVKLLPEDVPGAVLKYDAIEDHSVVELKRWLQCRGLNQLGKKIDFIQRVRHCPEDHDIFQGIDGGKWYEMKLKSAQAAHPEVAEEIFNTWGVFPSVDVPKFFNSGHIYYYLVESCPIPLTNDSEGEEEENVPGAEKALKRGEIYVKSGHVRNVSDAAGQNFVKYKSNIDASMRNLTYTTTVTLSKKSGSVDNASCGCPQSSLARCSHVSALLQFILQYCTVNGYEALTSTSKPRTWGLGKKEKNPGMVKMLERDPRPSHLVDHSNTPDVSAFLYELQVVNQNTIWENTLEFEYGDFELTKEEEAVVAAQTDIFINSLTPLDSLTLDPMLIPGTEAQSESSAWFAHRRVIFTASEAKTVLGLKPETWKNFLRNKLWSTESIRTKAMAYGSRSEDFARSAYLSAMSDKFNDVRVHKTGLWVSREYPIIGCSPDGIVSYEENSKIRTGLVEIKCPFILKEYDPNDFTEVLTKTQVNNFCLVKAGDAYTLKTNHSYYYQIQVQLGVHKLQWCDLVIWAKRGMIIVRVEFDEMFYINIRQRLVYLHRTILVPEYFLMRTIRKLDPISIN